MTSTASSIDLSARPARPVLALVLALLSVPGSMLTWDTLPGGGFVWGFPLGRRRDRARHPGAPAHRDRPRQGARRDPHRRRDGGDHDRLDDRRVALRPSDATRTLAAALIALVSALAACGDGDDDATSPTAKTDSGSAAAPSRDELDRVVKIERDRGLYVRCTGTGSPTVVMEGGDDDTSDSYAFAEPAVSKVTRACVYDRANLGRSDPAPGPRGLAELVGDLERLLRGGEDPRPLRPGRHVRRRLHHRRVRVRASTAGRRDGLRRRRGAVPESASRDRRRHRSGQPGERREARLPAGREGRLERPRADRGHPRDDHHRRALRRSDQGVAVPVRATRNAAQRRRPEGLARAQPACEADRRPHRPRRRGGRIRSS